MKANSDEMRDVIYQVGMKFKDSLSQKAFGLVSLDQELAATSFYIAFTDEDRKELIKHLRELANQLEQM